MKKLRIRLWKKELSKMAFFVRKERCKYCAGELVDGKCTNPNCIAYVDTTKTNEKTTTENKEGANNA